MRFAFISLLAAVSAVTMPDMAFAASANAASSIIILTEDDISDRPYQPLGDLKVTVRKQTLFSPEPDRARVDEKLKEAAARLGADAVILVRYGTIGMGLIGWGELEGRGRAIRFD